MQAGKLDRLITIERGRKSMGDLHPCTLWSVIAAPRAQLVRVADSEFATGFGEATAGEIVFRIRWREGITTADRIAYGGRHYEIKEIAEIGRRRGLELRAVATT